MATSEKCTEGSKAVFAKGDNCAQYYDCSSREATVSSDPTVRECEFPLLFNDVTKQCEHFSQVTCGLREEPLDACKSGLLSVVICCCRRSCCCRRWWRRGWRAQSKVLTTCKSSKGQRFIIKPEGVWCRKGKKYKTFLISTLNWKAASKHQKSYKSRASSFAAVQV